jgi:2,3-bisphosphoglycerate-independent phosphoglycerate mutase
MSESSRPRPVVLCILDGWGYREDCTDNALCKASMPVWRRLMESCPHALLDASAHAVGLPSGQMGNSEVGHMNLGAGRVVLQDLPRIDRAVADGSLAKSPLIAQFVAKLKASHGRAHLLGLLSPGGVHSHQDQLAALANILTGAGVDVVFHALLDGRDTPPRSALGYLDRFLGALEHKKDVEIGTVGGRYFAMDRDKRWDRVALAYDAIVQGRGIAASDARSAIEAGYARGENDEFIKPSVIAPYRGIPDGDGLVAGNFRADRMRQILDVLIDPDFDGFARKRHVRFAAFLGMVQYSDELATRIPALFPPESLSGTLGEVVAKAGLHQLRIAETEKYAHVTYFFSGGQEKPFEGEERILVPSPQVATYDLKPEMSAPEMTDKLTAAIASGTFDLIVVNYANGDMVGHSGILAAAAKAAETVDRCLGRLERAVHDAGGLLLVTADHGNLEEMRDPKTGQPHTAHTTNPVPLVLVNGPAAVTGLEHGRLADVAPTILALMGLRQPAAMTGHSLLHQARAGERPARRRA